MKSEPGAVATGSLTLWAALKRRGYFHCVHSGDRSFRTCSNYPARSDFTKRRLVVEFVIAVGEPTFLATEPKRNGLRYYCFRRHRH
jgi:hypothetical protein